MTNVLRDTPRIQNLCILSREGPGTPSSALGKNRSFCSGVRTTRVGSRRLGVWLFFTVFHRSLRPHDLLLKITRGELHAAALDARIRGPFALSPRAHRAVELETADMFLSMFFGVDVASARAETAVPVACCFRRSVRA